MPRPIGSMDVLKVGKSLGAGSLALLMKDAAGKDTLVRLGGKLYGKHSVSKSGRWSRAGYLFVYNILPGNHWTRYQCSSCC